MTAVQHGTVITNDGVSNLNTDKNYMPIEPSPHLKGYLLSKGVSLPQTRALTQSLQRLMNIVSVSIVGL